MLIYFLSMYARDESVRDAYAREPRETLKKYEVSDNELKLIAKVGLEAAVGVELTAMLKSSDEAIADFGWGVEDMVADGYTHTPTGRGSFELTVTGKDFTSKTTVALVARRRVQDRNESGKYRTRYTYIDAKSTRFVSAKKLIGTMSRVPPGNYWVAVYRIVDNTRLGAYVKEPRLVVDPRDGGPGGGDGPPRGPRAMSPTGPSGAARSRAASKEKKTGRK